MTDLKIEFVVKDGLQSFARGRLKKATKEMLEEKFHDLGYDILVLETRDANLYHSKLVQLSHENLLRSIVVLGIPNSIYSIICFEECFSGIPHLSSLLFDGDGLNKKPCDMSSILRKFIFQIAKTLHLLHTRREYHGYLKNESTFLSDVGGQFNVKLFGIRGLSITAQFNKKICDEDWNDLGELIRDIFAKNNRIPDYSVQSYIDHLRGTNPSCFAFNHPIWLSSSRKISLILEMEEAQSGERVPSMSNSYWPKNARLKEILESEPQRKYTRDVLGFVRLLKNKYCHPRFGNTSYEEFNGNFILFLKEVEKENPEIWSELLKETKIDLQPKTGDRDYEQWYNSVDHNQLAAGMEDLTLAPSSSASASAASSRSRSRR